MTNIPIGGSAQGGEPRPGRAPCECQHEKHGAEGCQRSGYMTDGWFICQYCQHHAPQLLPAAAQNLSVEAAVALIRALQDLMPQFRRD